MNIFWASMESFRVRFDENNVILQRRKLWLVPQTSTSLFVLYQHFWNIAFILWKTAMETLFVMLRKSHERLNHRSNVLRLLQDEQWSCTGMKIHFVVQNKELLTAPRPLNSLLTICQTAEMSLQNLWSKVSRSEESENDVQHHSQRQDDGPRRTLSASRILVCDSGTSPAWVMSS